MCGIGWPWLGERFTLLWSPGPPRGGERGGQWPWGPWTLGGPLALGRPIMRPVGFRGSSRGPIEMTLRNQYVEDDLFWESASKSEKTVAFCLENFFFLRLHQNPETTVAFSSVLEYTKSEIPYIWADTVLTYGSRPNPAWTRKLILSPNYARKKTTVKLVMRNLAMLPDYFDYIFVHLR